MNKKVKKMAIGGNARLGNALQQLNGGKLPMSSSTPTSRITPIEGPGWPNKPSFGGKPIMPMRQGPAPMPAQPMAPNMGQPSPSTGLGTDLSSVMGASSMTPQMNAARAKNGGKINLKNCKVSTHEKNKSSKDW